MDVDHITDHFAWSEGICHDGTPIPDALKPNALRLAMQLEIIRAEWAKLIAPATPAIIPVCWYRTPAHNENLRMSALASGRVPGTAVNSQHMLAAAIDARPVRLGDLPRFRDLIQGLLTAKALPLIGGWAYYPGQWIHLDVRPKPSNGHVATWPGKGIASEMA
jgi:hypothetical protein